MAATGGGARDRRHTGRETSHGFFLLFIVALLIVCVCVCLCVCVLLKVCTSVAISDQGRLMVEVLLTAR